MITALYGVIIAYTRADNMTSEFSDVSPLLLLLLLQMFELMSAAGPNASWEVLESALFIMLAVAKYVEP